MHQCLTITAFKLAIFFVSMYTTSANLLHQWSLRTHPLWKLKNKRANNITSPLKEARGSRSRSSEFFSRINLHSRRGRNSCKAIHLSGNRVYYSDAAATALSQGGNQREMKYGVLVVGGRRKRTLVLRGSVSGNSRATNGAPLYYVCERFGRTLSSGARQGK